MNVFFSRSYRLFRLLTSIALMWGSVTTLVGAAAPTRDGITLQSTRVIYPQDEKKGITFTLKNDAQAPYLIQSRVLNGLSDTLAIDNTTQQHEASPFVVLPPLKRLDVDEALTLTIRRTAKRLPNDRESVFALQIKAIPTESDSNERTAMPGQIKVMLALENTLKLFYRPEQLPAYNLEQISEKLRFVRQGDQLIVSNGSPYYVTFSTLNVGNHSVDENALFQMVPPLGEQSYPLSPSVSGEISWQLVNDYGRASESFHRPLIQ